MDKYVILLLAGILESCCVKINRLQVPPLVSLGTPVVLDCEYSLDYPKDEELVVKWFFNEKIYPVYQWIPEARPQELGILKGRLDLSYRASEEKHKVHRALKITKLGPELSGNFTCSVSTFSSEDSQTKEMLVFVPEKILDLRYPSNYADDHSKVICFAEEVYPKPELRLYLNGSEIENTTISIEVTNNGLYSIELAAIVDNLLDGTEVVCELTIIQANYTVKKEAIYYKARTAASYGHSSQLTYSSILHICLFLLYKLFF